MSRFPDLPATMRSLPVDHRGFPVPYFVAWVDGAPHFPAMDGRKLEPAMMGQLCWVCGKRLGRLAAFVVGPMCIINRTSAEPPSHPQCARFSAIHCPFLANPNMARVPEAVHVKRTGHGTQDAAGIMLPHNPGACAVWLTRRYMVKGDGRGGLLMDIGKPHRVEWYAHGRRASRAEVVAAIDKGLPALAALVDGPEAQADFSRRCKAAMEYLPHE